MKRALRLAVSLAALGCSDPVGVGRPFKSVDPAWVTTEVAAELDAATGLFNKLWPDSSTLTSSQTAELATGYLALLNAPTSTGDTKSVAQADRGAPIAWTQLGICWRPTFVHSPWARPPDTVPPAVRRYYSAQWSVSLCGADGRAQAAVGIADADASGLLSVDPQAWLLTDSLSGRFSVTGMPSRFTQGLPLPPEQAVAFLFRATGRPIASVPEAYNPVDENFIGQLPPCGAWRIRLDSAISVRGEQSGVQRSIAEFFVRRDPGCFASLVSLWAATEVQPTERWIRYRWTGGGPIDSVSLMLRGPVRFERVTPVTP